MKARIVSWHWLWQRLMLEFGFRMLYPLAAHLPARSGRKIARLWGRWMAWLDCEWRSVALREHFVAQRTASALAEIEPGLTEAVARRKIAERFMAACEEELEGHWLAYGLKTQQRVLIEGLDALRTASAAGRGLLLLTFHYDAAIWGIGCLGRAGLRLSPMSSAVTEDARVPHVVQGYFARKYAGLTRHLQGGQVMHHEHRLRDFYRRLKRGEGVVVLADAFTHDARTGLPVDFLGRQRLFAPGIRRLAEKSAAAVAAFVCLREGDDYRIAISRPSPPGVPGDEACRQALHFLEGYVRTFPERWWAADLLPGSLRPESAVNS